VCVGCVTEFLWGMCECVVNTNHAEGSFMVRRQQVKLKRGQIGWSELTMAERWKWSRGKVRRFLKKLENEHMIEQQTGHLTSVITICNYNEFQGDGKEDGTTNDTTYGTAGGTSDEHQTVQQAVHKQECKELKNDNNVNNLFETFWSSGMQKVGKKKAMAAFKTAAKKHGDIEQFTSILINDVKQRISVNQFGFDKLHPERYLKNERWTDEVTAPTNLINQKDQQRQQMIEARNRELGIAPNYQNDFIDGEVLRHD